MAAAREENEYIDFGSETDDGGSFNGSIDLTGLAEEVDLTSDVISAEVFVNENNPLEEEGSPDIKTVSRKAKIGEIKDQMKLRLDTGTYTKMDLKVFNTIIDYFHAQFYVLYRIIR